MFQRAAEGMRGEEALAAMGKAYGELLPANPIDAAGADAGVRGLRRPRDRARVVRRGLRRLVDLRRAGVRAPTGRGHAASSPTGMLLNVHRLDGAARRADEPWAERLLAGCKDEA